VSSTRLSYLIAASTLVLAGCLQSPIVRERVYTYHVVFSVDDKNHQLSTSWSCYLENVDWVNLATDARWHPRGPEAKNVFKIVGTSEDGTRFEAVPADGSFGYSSSPCPDSSEDLDSVIFVSPPGSAPEVAGFDRQHIQGSHYQIRILESKLALSKTGVAGFTEWPTPETPAQRYYYSVTITKIPQSIWARDDRVSGMIEAKQIDWINGAKPLPWNAATDGTGAFYSSYVVGIERTPGYVAPKAQYLVPRDDSWTETENHTAATTWREGTGHYLKLWVDYDGTRIEIQGTDLRFVFDPGHKELVELRTEHVGLW